MLFNFLIINVWMFEIFFWKDMLDNLMLEDFYSFVVEGIFCLFFKSYWDLIFDVGGIDLYFLVVYLIFWFLME